MRAWATWQFNDPQDVSYVTMGLALWTWAELSSGIILSCLPTTPRFFRHISPKINSMVSDALKFDTRSRDATASRWRSTSNNDISRVPGAQDPYGGSARPKGPYISLDDIQPSSQDKIDKRAHIVAAGPATKRDDFERAYEHASA